MDELRPSTSQTLRLVGQRMIEASDFLDENTNADKNLNKTFAERLRGSVVRTGIIVDEMWEWIIPNE